MQGVDFLQGSHFQALPIIVDPASAEKEPDILYRGGMPPNEVDRNL